MPGAAVGLVSDTAIGIHLVVHHGRAPRSWSITGTVAWAPIMGMAFDSGNFAPHSQESGFFAYASTGAAFTVGSLAFAVYGLAHPTVPSTPSASARSVISFSPPVLLPAEGGARMLIGGSF
jgi:hypothetical protein